MAVATLMVAITGCDSIWKMDLTVQVPVDVQAAVTLFPQEVRVRWGYRGAGYWFVDSLGILCSAGAEHFEVSGRIEGVLGKCPGPIDVVAWLEQLDPQGTPTCGPRREPEELGSCSDTDYPCGPATGAPRGEGTAFESGCRTSDLLSLTVHSVTSP